MKMLTGAGFNKVLRAALDVVERGCSPNRLSNWTLAISEWRFDRSHKKRVPCLNLLYFHLARAAPDTDRHLP
jgi:hypothetical protein